MRRQALFLELEGERGALKVVPALAGRAGETQILWSERPGVWEPLPLDPGLLRGRDPGSLGPFPLPRARAALPWGRGAGGEAHAFLREGILAQAVIQAVVESAEEGTEKEVERV